jgi:hypothetical protein
MTQQQQQQQQQQHPITPPPELVQQWVDAYFGGGISHVDLAAQAAQWGADQELEACCEWLSVPCPSYGRELRNARRLKPPSLKEQALDLLDKAEDPSWDINDFSIIRRALEQLPDNN